MSRHAMSRHAMSRHSMSRHAIPRHATSRATDAVAPASAPTPQGAAWPSLAHEPVERPAEHHSILYYRSLAVQKMAGGGAASGRHQNIVQSYSGSGFDLDSIGAMDKSVPKVMLRSSEVSVLESVGEAR